MAIVQTTPINFATDVIRNIFIRVKFDIALDRSTIDDHSVILVETDNPNNRDSIGNPGIPSGVSLVVGS